MTKLQNQPFLWDGEHYHNQLTEELRLSFDPVHNLSGTAGAFYSYTRTAVFHPRHLCHGHAGRLDRQRRGSLAQ